MQLFKKKPAEQKEEEIVPTSNSVSEVSADDVPVAARQEAPQGPATSADRLGLEVEKLKAQFASFYELNKATGERFTRVNEQIGELRTMIIDMDRAKQKLEAKALQAIDIVESVQPDKIMIELRKEDAKVEAVRATMDSHEAIIANVLSEVKDLRNRLAAMRGMEETLKMSEQVKGDLIEMKKTQALTQRHADRVETIFAEMTKNSGDLVKFKDMTNDLNNGFKKMLSDMDSMSVRIESAATKKEFDDLMAKFSLFEKRISSLVELINTKLDQNEKRLDSQMDEKFKSTEKLVAGFKNLAKKVPELDKYFGLIEEEARKIPDEVKVEKLKELGNEQKLEPEDKKKMFDFKNPFKKAQ